MRKIRALVAEDSVTVRKRLVEVLGADPELEVVGEAEDGRQAIELCKSLRPDVVTLDMMLPIMSGLAATEYIMAYFPTPILIVSSSTNRGELFRTYEALAAGAVDVLEKPLGNELDDDWERKLVSTVKLVSRIKVITHPRARLAESVRARYAGDAAGARAEPASAPGSSAGVPGWPQRGRPRLIAIGASTGGPGALLEILRELDAGFPLPILLVLHIGTAFGTALAEWLDGQSSLPVAFAVDGEPLPAAGVGRVIMAPPDRHLVLRQGRLRLTSEPLRHSCRPSVDELFESVARELGSASAACLLTGMGRDGADGLLAIHRAGGVTLAQDEATCVVFGMPREAILLGAAGRVLPLPQIAPSLLAIAQGKDLRRTP
ncbi:MAG: chemotaxis-specific protein-glutamate methyltransferase CheB [Planctomycetes bacterium]|nr:chemotaxis-specific protein-glutamate methyltransferase CheB [Planctomycetota bacterium]